MRVLLVHSSPLSHLGGAEVSLREHIRAAPPGVTVDTILPDQLVDLERYDAVILANLRPNAQLNNGHGQDLKQWIWERLNHSPLQMIALRNEIAWAELWRRRLKGYRGYVIKSERDVHPCASRDGSCIDVATKQRSPCGPWQGVARAFERLYNCCDAVQFLSPLHRWAINMMVKIDVPQYEIAPPLDRSLFRDYTPAALRKNLALLIADRIRDSPGAEQRAREAGFEVERIEYLSVPYERMPALLNQYRAVVVAPVMLHGFGRLAAEALACGCRLLASERVGALSWPDPLEACRQSNPLFWGMVMHRPDQPNPRRLQNGAKLVTLWH